MKKSETHSLRNKISLASLAIVLISLPLGLIASSQTQNISPKATVIQDCQQDWSKVVTITENASDSAHVNYFWPNTCRGNLSANAACGEALVILNIVEITKYNQWTSQGSPPTTNVCTLKNNQDDATDSAQLTLPSPRPSPLSNQIRYETDTVRAYAEDFFIFTNGKFFFARDSEIQIHSDPGSDDYTTLELIWQEHGVQMRWFTYFRSDGINWWSDEMRIYDGSEHGDWVYFKDPEGYFTSQRNIPYTKIGSGQLYISDDNTSAIFLEDINFLSFKDGSLNNLKIDLNNDGLINIIDYSIFISEFVKTLNQ